MTLPVVGQSATAGAGPMLETTGSACVECGHTDRNHERDKKPKYYGPGMMLQQYEPQKCSIEGSRTVKVGTQVVASRIDGS